MNFSKNHFDNAANEIYKYMSPSAQLVWPLLNNYLGHETWVKHENHNPTGAFKVRGGIYYLSELAKEKIKSGLVSATRGNHGQSIAFAAQKFGFETDIFVPCCNCASKNEAMCAFGAKLHQIGDSFDEAKQIAQNYANEKMAHYVNPFNEKLVLGVGTYAYELMMAHRDFDKIYVPIGGGSGVCGLIKVRDALGLKTQIIGVVSENFDAFYQSLKAGKIINTECTNTIADGLAVKEPSPAAFDIVKNGVDNIICVSDEEIAHAMNIIFETTKNIAEGAGAASVAAAIKEKNNNKGKKIAVILSGGNISKNAYIQILSKQAA